MLHRNRLVSCYHVPSHQAGAAFLGLVLLFASQASQAATFSWNAGSGFWATAGNWSPAGPPGIGDIARLGNLPGVANDQVSLGQNDSVGELHITDGTTFSNQDHTFSVIGDTFLAGFNEVPHDDGLGSTHNHSRIFIQPTAAPVQFTTDNLVVTDEARVRLYQGGVVEVRDRLTVDNASSVYGEGAIRLIDSGVVMSNSGTIDPDNGTMVLNVTGGGSIDLDGLGSGRVQLQWAGEQLTINGGTLTDAFSGEMLIDGDAVLAMYLDAPWEADASSEIRLGWGNNGVSADHSVITGAPVTLGGAVDVSYGSFGRIDSHVTFADSAAVTIHEQGTGQVLGDTVVEGGVFVLEEDANLFLSSDIEMRGGHFTTHSQLSSEGAVRLDGPTEWRGDVVIDGIATQIGNATVSSFSTIDAGIFDMDGGGGTEWSIGSIFTVNADSIDSTISNTFDGVLVVGGGALGRLNLNLTGAFDSWTMNGQMFFQNDLPFPATRLSGSPMRMTGQIGIDENGIRITSDLTLGAGSETVFANPTATLLVTGATTVESGASFLFGGELHNQASGALLLEDGANMGISDLRNAGLLSVADGAGGAVVDDVTLEETAIWHIEIGGHAAISEHDHLSGLGAVELSGLVEVSLIDTGSGLFLPEIGDAFTVLTSLNPLSGAFLNDPISMAAGQHFHWEVVHEPNTVTLVLQNITGTVPEPTALAGLLVAMAATALRQQR